MDRLRRVGRRLLLAEPRAPVDRDPEHPGRLACPGPGDDQGVADALTASASGLDPDISPAYATWQAPRVAAARGTTTGQVQALVDAHTKSRLLGFLGQPRVNVTELNLALTDAAG